LCRLMARLEEGERGDLVAARRWLMAATDAPPDPVWVCSHCSTAAAEWTARCSHCGEFDSLSWKESGRVVLALGPAMADARPDKVRYLPAAAQATSANPAGAAAEASQPSGAAAPVDAARLIN